MKTRTRTHTHTHTHTQTQTQTHTITHIHTTHTQHKYIYTIYNFKAFHTIEGLGAEVKDHTVNLRAMYGQHIESLAVVGSLHQDKRYKLAATQTFGGAFLAPICPVGDQNFCVW